MEDSATKNKRIAKNTLLLYIRTFITMVVSLFTSRITLEALGIDNYGVYNVVGGLVSMFTILSSPISNAISRFLTFGLGKGDLNKLQLIFSTSINVLLALGCIVVIAGETIGLWFLNYKLNIPYEDMAAANWVLQCSIISMVLQLINVPYSAAIISHEKMGVYAYMSILDVMLRLGLVFLLLRVTSHVLIIYAMGTLLIYIIDRVICGIYCTKNFKECHYVFVLDKKLIRDISSFAGWAFLGNTAYMLNTQGVAMLMNIFAGVVVNAAKGISSQVENAVMSFVNSFTAAFTPQIIKSYAEGDKVYMFSVMARGSKFSFYLMLLVLIPLEFETPIVLKLWLENVPDYTVSFIRLSLVCTSIVILGNPYVQGLQATGEIKIYQMCVSAIVLLVFPITWILYRCGFNLTIFYWIFIIMYFIASWVRMWFVQKQLGYRISSYIQDVFFPIIKCSFFSLLIPSLIVTIMEESINRLLILTILSIISSIISIYIFGINKSEREHVNMSVHSKFFKSN